MIELARSHATDAINTLVAAMNSDSAPRAARIAAANAILDRGWGKPKETVDVTARAEFERAMIRERVKSGLERAKAQGKILGRPPIDPRKEAAILDDLRAGKAGIKLAAAQRVGVGTVQRIKASLDV